MVNQERVLLAAEALRSGEYKQGYYSLKAMKADHAVYCPLGVFCEVAILNGLSIETGMGSLGRVWFEKCGSYGFLPRSVQEWYGLPSNDPELWLSSRGGSVETTFANDTLSLPFSEIADAFVDTYCIETPEHVAV